MKKINCDYYCDDKKKLKEIFDFLKDSDYEGDDDIEAETATFLTNLLKMNFVKIPNSSKAKFWSFSPFNQKVTICLSNDSETCGYKKNIAFFEESLKTEFNNENFIKYYVNNKFCDFIDKGFITINSSLLKKEINLYFYEIEYLETSITEIISFFSKALNIEKDKININNCLKVNDHKELLIDYFQKNENCFFNKHLGEEIFNEYFNDAEFGLNKDTKTIAFFDITKSGK